MEQPGGFILPHDKSKICKLQSSIYGLKQASRTWNIRFDEVIKTFDFIQNPDESCVYKKTSGSDIAFLVLYVDDILIFGNNLKFLASIKEFLFK